MRTTNITKEYKMDFVSPFRLFVSWYQLEVGAENFVCDYYNYRSNLHLDKALKERFEWQVTLFMNTQNGLTLCHMVLNTQWILFKAYI